MKVRRAFGLLAAGCVCAGVAWAFFHYLGIWSLVLLVGGGLVIDLARPGEKRFTRLHRTQNREKQG